MDDYQLILQRMNNIKSNLISDIGKHFVTQLESNTSVNDSFKNTMFDIHYANWKAWERINVR